MTDTPRCAETTEGGGIGFRCDLPFGHADDHHSKVFGTWNVLVDADRERRLTDKATAYRLARDLAGQDAPPMLVLDLADWLLDDTATGPPPLPTIQTFEAPVMVTRELCGDINPRNGHQCVAAAGHLDDPGTPHVGSAPGDLWQRHTDPGGDV